MASTAGLEIFRHRLESIVEEMGLTLQRTAYSTNIKIRRDHTCALFDADLRHVAQHDIAPQHIGSLVSVVQRNLEEYEDDFAPGDGLLINDPALGAVHLPDVMLVSPIFHEDEIVGYAANSAHHVDIGGSVPGGIPNDSTELYQEGLILPAVKAVEDWEYHSDMLKLIARNVRGADKRRADYRSQLGANKIGADQYRTLIADRGLERVEADIDHLLEYTERRVRAAIRDLPNGTYTAEDHLDGDGITDDPVKLALSITISDEEILVDFSDTAEQNKGPLNCTPAMVFAGTLSVIIALLGEQLPKNDGFYRPFDFVTPEGSMVNPDPDAPVAAGWEIAMRAGDLVTKALADAIPEETIAATKGIVCNVAYGGYDSRRAEDFVYYETVGGGYGARKDSDGMDAVQTHFQNTANSPIEELETELPVRVRRYELIPDSAGAGRTRGGLGVRRDIEFYDDEAVFSVLSDRTQSAPWGLFGGGRGRTANYVLNPESEDRTTVSSKSVSELEPGDVASIQTPGGGGYGNPFEREVEAVVADVRDEKVSNAAAESDYGVVIDAETKTVDEAATIERCDDPRSTDGDCV